MVQNFKGIREKRSPPPSFVPQAVESPSNIVTLFFQALLVFFLHTLFWAPAPFTGGC